VAGSIVRYSDSGDLFEVHLADRALAGSVTQDLWVHWTGELAFHAGRRGGAVRCEGGANYRTHEHSWLERVVLVVDVDGDSHRSRLFVHNRLHKRDPSFEDATG
jgi:hypothetical protein